jgi:protein O-mannosyl-transferase
MKDDLKFILRVAIFCLALAAICYWNSLANEFMGDDYMLVALNPAIRTIAPVQYLSSPFWGQGSTNGIYRPLVMFSFSIDYSIWKRWAPGFHLTNILLHALNGVLVFVLARSLLMSTPAAWAATAVFVAHPVHAESVASIAGRSELLAGIFFFAAWLLFRKKRTVLCSIAFLMSMLSKENAVAFPIVMAVDIWISEGHFKRLLQAWKRFVLPGLSAALYLSLRLSVLGSIGMPQSSQYLQNQWTLLQRELTSGRAFLKYFQLLLAPIPFLLRMSGIGMPGLRSF